MYVSVVTNYWRVEQSHKICSFLTLPVASRLSDCATGGRDALELSGILFRPSQSHRESVESMMDLRTESRTQRQEDGGWCEQLTNQRSHLCDV